MPWSPLVGLNQMSETQKKGSHQRRNLRLPGSEENSYTARRPVMSWKSSTTTAMTSKR